MSNTASVSANETDSVLSNNTSNVAPVVVDEIPTLGEWGLILFALMLAVAGALALRR
jgi:predicted membrane-bound spermidine synthase